MPCYCAPDLDELDEAKRNIRKHAEEIVKIIKSIVHPTSRYPDELRDALKLLEHLYTGECEENKARLMKEISSTSDNMMHWTLTKDALPQRPSKIVIDIDESLFICEVINNPHGWYWTVPDKMFYFIIGGWKIPKHFKEPTRWIYLPE